MNQTNYRIMGQTSGGQTIYSIHEVIYNIYDEPIDYIKVPVSMISLDLEEMIEEIQFMLEAFDLPVLSIDNFPKPLWKYIQTYPTKTITR